MFKWLTVAALCGSAALLLSQPAAPEIVGPLPSGGTLLNSGWILHPAGTQIPMDTMPMASLVTPDNKFLLVLHGGLNPPSLHVLDLASMKTVSRAPLPDAWLGLTITRNGRLVYVSGASQSAVYEYSISNQGALQLTRTFEIVPAASRQPQDFVGDITLSPDERLLYVAMLQRDAIAVVNPQSGRVIEKFATGPRPYRLLFHPDGKSFFVSSWAGAAVYQHKAETGERLSLTRVAPHPTDMLLSDRKPQDAEQTEGNWSHRLFVAASNTNRVYSFGLSENKDLRPLESIHLSLDANSPAGMSPSALALDATQQNLFVACSGVNATAVVNLESLRSRVEGFIPTGWYPTAVRALADGRLIVLNGHGSRSFPNPEGMKSTRQTGSLSVIPKFDTRQLDRYTRDTLDGSPYRPDMPVPASLPPIEHVVYILKEGRSYDQIFGALGRGNGDPALAAFPSKVTPNHHKLAREFTLFDNFYSNGDTPADGLNWSASAFANDFVQKLSPSSAAGRRRFPDADGGDLANTPPAGYLWSNALSAGLTVRNFGWWVTNTPKPASPQIASVREPSLRPVTNLLYRGFDLDFPDVERAKVFLAELSEWERSGQFPNLILIRLANDQTSGTAPGKLSPASAMADNDLALGTIVEGISRSKMWPTTAVFVLESSARFGADHVDSHRIPALLISPYARRGFIDSTMLNTTSALRTMEWILGLKPMTIFDASARTLSNAFTPTPVLTPYQIRARVRRFE